MKKIFSLLLVTIYILFFLGCEYGIHRTENIVEIGMSALITLRVVEWICAVGVIIETLEIVFDLDIKGKIKTAFDEWSDKK